MTQEKSVAYNRGYEARRQGQHKTSCPYQYLSITRLHWHNGYDDCDMDLAKSDHAQLEDRRSDEQLR